MSFKPENIFFLLGHGTENLHDPQRYKLKKNQYAAIALYPGELLFEKWHTTFSEIIIKTDLNIKIPKGGKYYTNNLGFADYLGAFTNNKKYLKIENFKIYRPKMGDYDKQSFWYTIPDITYFPTAQWLRKVSKMITNRIYKGVVYNDLKKISLQLSGIIQKNKQLGFSSDDIENFDQAFPFLSNNTLKRSDFIPWKQISKYECDIFYPKGVIDKKIIDIINDKEKDPLAYDFYYWLRASYKDSMVPLDDFLLIYYFTNFSENTKSQSPFEDYKKLKNQLTQKELNTFIISTFSLRNILKCRISLKYVYDLIDEIVKPIGPYIIFPFICRSLKKEATTRTIKSAKRKSRPRHTRKLKRNFYTKSKDEFE